MVPSSRTNLRSSQEPFIVLSRCQLHEGSILGTCYVGLISLEWHFFMDIKLIFIGSTLHFYQAIGGIFKNL